MTDIAHTYGQDLQVSATGDILVSQGTQNGQERVYRRLMTAPGAYIWQLQYGAGLPGFVGNPINAGRIGAVARAQMYREAAVSRDPAPVISSKQQPDGQTVILSIQYVDAATQTPVVLSLNLP